MCECVRTHTHTHTHTYIHTHIYKCRNQRPRGLRRGSASARLLGLRVRISPGTLKSVCCQCCVWSGKGLVLPSVVCLSTIVKPRQLGDPGPLAAVAPQAIHSTDLHVAHSNESLFRQGSLTEDTDCSAPFRSTDRLLLTVCTSQQTLSSR